MVKGSEKSIDLPALKISNLTKAYGKKVIIKDIDLAVRKGEVFGYIGRNGTGKSTTISCIVGLKPFKEGQILIDGKDIKADSIAAKKLLGYVPSEPACYEMMTGWEYLSFVGSAFGLHTKEIEPRLQHLISEFDFNPEDLNRKIGLYSLGMKQKMSLIAALVHDPLLLVLDEPTIGLDALATQALIRLILERKSLGRSTFITSHSIDLVGKVCDRVAILKDAKIVRIVDLQGGDTVQSLQEAFASLCRPEKERV